jgi:hypothetical protein
MIKKRKKRGMLNEKNEVIWSKMRIRIKKMKKISLFIKNLR